MFGVLIAIIFSLVCVTAALLFGILSFTQKKPVFFYLGIIFVVISLLINLSGAEFFIYSLQEGDLFSLCILGAWITAIVFLALSKTTPNKRDDGITDSFLNDIINADDEDWDPES